MNEKNFEYLSKQLQYTGFGESLQPQLKDAMQKGEAQFMLPHVPDFDRERAAVTLHFKKSDTQDNYFFNRYNVHVHTPQLSDAVKQTFYLNHGQDNVTLKEAYNLLHGRSVYKEMTPKEGEKYNAWLQLDFKNTESSGNYKIKQFHSNYGFDLDAALGKHPIKELGDPQQKERLIESLQRGNRQSVTFEKDGLSQKIFVEAAPQFKSLNFFTEKGGRVTLDLINAYLEAAQKKEAKTTKRELNEDDEGAKMKKEKRKGISV